MKPGDHPEFFRFPAPEGRSRESTIRLDAAGRFWHDRRRVDHPALASAFHAWIGRHPDDGRFILSNGYDWTYFTVEDAPYFVLSLRIEPREGVALRLSDGTSEPWHPESTRVGPDGALYATVRAAARGGPFEAKFTQHAQSSLAPLLVVAEGPDAHAPGAAGEGRVFVRIDGRLHAIAPKKATFG
jgi:uncharacterized protein